MKLLLLNKRVLRRDDLTISNYFYKLRENLPLSEEQNRLYDILKHPRMLILNIFLKHVTTFLLKYVKEGICTSKKEEYFC